MYNLTRETRNVGEWKERESEKGGRREREKEGGKGGERERERAKEKRKWGEVIVFAGCFFSFF
jgi:hypothetical protein